MTTKKQTTKKQAMKKPTLSPTSKRLVEAFDEAAQAHGWERDQGSMAGAHEALLEHAKAKDALIKRITNLEAQVRRLNRYKPSLAVKFPGGNGGGIC